MGLFIKFKGFLEIGHRIVYLFQFGEYMVFLFVDFDIYVVYFVEEFRYFFVPWMDGGGEREQFGRLLLI